MSGRHTTVSVLIILVLMGIPVWSATPTLIKTLELSHEGGFTILTIHGTGQLRYAHQSVEAEDGKAFRIVVDCLAARHGLARMNFSKLPTSVITAIRTSQYAVTPEEVVRVVLDLAEESVYRVEADNTTLKVLVSDQKTAAFPVWNSSPTATAVTTAAVPKKPSNTFLPVPKQMADSKPSVVARSEDEDKSQTPATAATAQPYTAGEAPKPPMKTPSPPKPKVTEQASTTTPAAPVTATDVVGDTVQKAKAYAKVGSDESTPTTKVPSKVPSKAASDKPEPPAPPTKTKMTDTKPVVPSSVKTDKDVQLASTAGPAGDAASEESSDTVNLSRYRRDVAKDAEMKATQVVQFPQRMVIKYKQTSKRDPFKTLVELDKKKLANFDLSRIPNVETLNLVGILESVAGKGAALLEDLDGIGYILKPGDRVKNGYVAQVDENAVYFQINEYGWGRTVVKHMEKND